jgi:hypothetical protein
LNVFQWHDRAMLNDLEIPARAAFVAGLCRLSRPVFFL